VVDAPFADKIHAVQCDLGITVLLLVNKKTKTIDRIALSNTELAKKALEITAVPFHEIKIPVSSTSNAIATAIHTQKLQKVSDWKYLFTPVMTAKASRFNQANAGIGCSMVVPLHDCHDGAAMIFSFYQQPEKINHRHVDFAKAYAALVGDLLRTRSSLPV